MRQITAFRLRGFRCGDGGDLGPRHGEKDGGHRCEHRDPAPRRESPEIDQVAEGGPMRGSPSEGERGRDNDEDDDGGHFDGREPELEFGIRTRGHEIHAGHDRHEPEPDLKR
jgi:hypothetical protein